MKGKFQRGESEEASLTLTPLLDMFTIILIFLIVSFEAQDKGFDPNQDVKLPKSRARSVFKPAVNVSITTDAVLVEKNEAVGLDDGQFRQSYYEKQQIPPLVEEFEKYYAAIRGEGTSEGTSAGVEVPETDKPILLVQADKKLEYKTLYLVLRSGALAGFTKYRLAIQKK